MAVVPGFPRLARILPALLMGGLAGRLGADDADVAKALREKGASVAESKGAVTSVDAPDCSAWTEEEYRRVAKLGRLRSLSLGKGVTDQALDFLCDAAELETLQTNECRITDDGLKPLLRLKKLKVLKFFHPAKTFSGAGLAHLAAHPTLESVTVAGSISFGDEGMAAVGKLAGLRELRTWHAGVTLEGVKQLKALKNLKSLTLGQRLAYEPPAPCRTRRCRFSPN